MAEQDFLYETPPLVEVIVEIRWALKPISLAPGMRMDPQFDALVSRATPRLEAMGFSFSETLKPADVPIELFGHQVVQRFRTGAGRWPVYQLGPGILTVNHVPPYNGWHSFRTTIEAGLALLRESYPVPDELLRIETMNLRYIDAFGKRHGFENYPDFIKKAFNVGIDIHPEILASRQDDTEPRNTLEMGLSLKTPRDSTGRLKIAHGSARGEEAAIVEFGVNSAQQHALLAIPEIMNWLDEAHLVLSDWFRHLCTPELKARMGNKFPITERT